MSPTTLTTFGLILDIIGAVMIWHFVAELSFADKAEFLKGKGTVHIYDPTPEQVSAYKRRVFLSRIGVALLVAGFSLQLLANVLPKSTA